MGFISLAIASPAFSAGFCDGKDDKAAIAALDAYFDASLKVHAQHEFSRSLKSEAKRRARALLEEKMLDREVELCADRLKLAEDISAQPAKWERAECAVAKNIELIEAYAQKVQTSAEENRKLITAYEHEHLRTLKKRLFAVIRGIPRSRYEWIKEQATILASEARRAWGATEPAKNPLVQQNQGISQEAERANTELAAARKQLDPDGKPPQNCRPKIIQ